MIQNIDGTSKSEFDIGTGSNKVGVRTNSGVFEVQDNGGSWRIVPAVATSTDNSSIRAAIDWDDTTGAISFSRQIPANSRVTKIVTNISTAFDGSPTGTFELGISGDTDQLMATTDTDLSSADLYVYDTFQEYESATDIIATWTEATSGSAGALTIEVFYTVS